MSGKRPVAATVLVVATLVMVPLVYAHAPDPTWMGGFWDDDDFGTIVAAVTLAAPTVPLALVDGSPLQIVVAVIADIKALTATDDPELEHAPRSPPSPR